MSNRTLVDAKRTVTVDPWTGRFHLIDACNDAVVRRLLVRKRRHVPFPDAHPGTYAHPGIISRVGHTLCEVALGVARDLRAGAIHNFDHSNKNCIAAHISRRSGESFANVLSKFDFPLGGSGRHLFSATGSSDRFEAADAIERTIREDCKNPWLKGG